MSVRAFGVPCIRDELANPVITSVILGATRVEQLTDTLAAA
jgi:hypothetical protein